MDEGQIMTNTEFDFPFAGKTYKVKKATLRQVIDFQRKVAEIGKENDAAGDLRMASYAIYLILHSIDANITEDFVTDNCEGDIDAIELFSTFGFMNQRKMVTLEKISNLLREKSNGENSSVS